jgi:dTDP-4-amino-4,6-dideoxygalactose transaminase
MEGFAAVLENKRETARIYQELFGKVDISFITETENAQSNYWLNATILKGRKERDAFLEATNAEGVQTRPVWKLMNHLPMYKDCHVSDLDNAQWFEDRLVNIPSSVRI